MDNATSLVQQIRERLPSQQDGLGHIEDAGAMKRLMNRAEMDAQWECVEVLGQRLDGVTDPVVRDYFAESHGGDQHATGRPPRRGWRRK